MNIEQHTSELEKFLSQAKKEDIFKFENQYLKGMNTSFPAYMDMLIEKKRMKRQDIFQKADIPQKYGYKLLTGESHTTDRDKILRLLIAMKATLKETQRALTLYGFSVLYPKVKRDAVLMIAFNKEIDSVETVNEWLEEAGEAPLSRISDD